MNKFVKYFLCIFFTILAINFIISITSFCGSISDYLVSSQLEQNPTNDSIISYANDLESSVEDVVDNLKQEHGEDYPALGVMYFKTVSHYSSVSHVQNLLFSLVCGFSLGNIIYLIFIARFKKYKLTIFLIIILLITGLLLSLSDILTFIANNEEIQFGLSEILWNSELATIPFVIATLVLCLIRKLRDVYVEIQNSV